jgi:hypothetical protein
MLSPCWVFSELKELGKTIVSAVTCFLCLGPVLSLIGIAFLVSTASDTRSATIASFNGAASKWSAGGAAGFGAMSGATYTLTGPTGGVLSLAKVSSLDNFGSDASDLRAPNMTVRYSAAASTGAPFPLTSGPSATASLTLARSGGTGSSALSATLFRLMTQSISCLVSDSSSKCSSRCDSGYSWGANTPGGSRTACYRYLRLNGICAVVDPATGLLDTAGGSGCALIDSSYSSFAGGSSGTIGSLGVFSYAASASAFNPTDFSGMTVTVRASTDPYVVLQRLTNGSMSLDLSVATKGVLGGALLAVGIVITVLTCLVIYYLISCFKRRNGAQQQGQVIDSGSGAPPPPTAAYTVQYSGGGGPPKEPQQVIMVPQGGYAVQMQGQQMYGGQQIAGGFAGPLPQQQHVAYVQAPYGQQVQQQQQQQQVAYQQPYAPQQQVFMGQQPVAYAPQQVAGYAPQAYDQQQYVQQAPPPMGYAYGQQPMGYQQR